MIRHVLDAYEQPIPAVLEIPSKDNPYDASKDSILRRAKVKCSIQDSWMDSWTVWIMNIHFAGLINTNLH